MLLAIQTLQSKYGKFITLSRLTKKIIYGNIYGKYYYFKCYFLFTGNSGASRWEAALGHLW